MNDNLRSAVSDAIRANIPSATEYNIGDALHNIELAIDRDDKLDARLTALHEAKRYYDALPPKSPASIEAIYAFVRARKAVCALCPHPDEVCEPTEVAEWCLLQKEGL